MQTTELNLHRLIMKVKQWHQESREAALLVIDPLNKAFYKGCQAALEEVLKEAGERVDE